MIAALVLAAACTPDIAAYSPTPVLTWTAPNPATIDGVTLWYRYPGGTAQKAVDLPCYDWPPGAAQPERVCPVSSGIGPPLPRYRDDELVEVEFAVDAYNRGGRSPTLSNWVRVCMPDRWNPGEPYQ